MRPSAKNIQDMGNNSQPLSDVTPAGDVRPQAGAPLAERSDQWIAPWWHLIIILALLLGNSLLGSLGGKSAIKGAHATLIVYAATFAFELIVVVLIWLAILRRGVTMRSLIGGRWDKIEDFLLDVAIGVVFWIVSLAILAGVRWALGTLNFHDLQRQAADTKRMLAPLIPKTGVEAACFVGLALGAGLFEEIIFRGYLQRQFTALTRNIWGGIALAAVVFGLGHGYQGGRMMIVIGVYGALFGILVYLRKSLRPGIMVHAFQDALSGLLLFFATKSGMF